MTVEKTFVAKVPISLLCLCQNNTEALGLAKHACGVLTAAVLREMRRAPACSGPCG